MDKIGKDLFRAIHEGKWLQIEYRNKQDQITKYWIGIRDLDPQDMSLSVDGLHIVKHTVAAFDRIYIDAICSSYVIEGSYQEKNQRLIRNIAEEPEKYERIFGNVANLKILNYLAECNRLDTTPYYSDYALLHQFDGQKLQLESGGIGVYTLSPQQFGSLMEEFGREGHKPGRLRQIELGLNLLSVHLPGKKELYVLAYRRLLFDIKGRCLRPAEDITICYEYEILESRQSIRQFLDAEDFGLLEDFEKNAELIKDKITRQNRYLHGVDDMPYMIAIGRFPKVDLKREYDAVIRSYSRGKDQAAAPIRAFFGDLTSKPVRRKDYPFALLNKRVNLDQLLAVNNAMKYPLAYIQGPPGTGKTTTIINTITTAFFNGRTVLFASYNNHPIDSVFEEMCGFHCRYGRIPFPIVRLGNDDKVEAALDYMKDIYLETQDITILEENLDKNRKREAQKLKQLSELLKRYEEYIDLQERKDAIDKLEVTQMQHFNFYADLHDRQKSQLEQRMKQLGDITVETALGLLPQDEKYLFQYFYFASARCIRRLDEPKNEELKEIILSGGEDRVEQFNIYLSREDNVERFLKIFPIVATTCISAHKIGKPKPYFDMVILDEASQCNTAVSLIPAIRGNNLMLVGDPQQLNPVITLNPRTNDVLKRMYYVTDEYDYIKNSIYKTYLACDSVSDEVLLSHHYRCHKKIIEFNNQKYYHGRLKIDSRTESDAPLEYRKILPSSTALRNTSPAEAEEIVNYVSRHPEKKIGIITPFTNQKECIREMLEYHKLQNVPCGTVHAFQGDEKDVILFSLAVTDKTGEGTYSWLKNNKELINVATSRAREKLIILADDINMQRLHGMKPEEEDDLYELLQYVKHNGETTVTSRNSSSRALGIKPYSTKTEEAFLENLNHALDNVLNGEGRCSIKKEVPIKQVFEDNVPNLDLFYTGQFDFVVYQRNYAKQEIPILAIELDGKEHQEDWVVRRRDEKKQQICRAHNFELIRIDNTYARRYQHIKDILIDYFKKVNGR